MAEPTSAFIGRGFAFPVIASANGRVSFVDGPAAIEQALRIILGTSPGERVMRPEFGCGIWELVMEANTAQLHGRVQARVREALTRWEPRIDVLAVNVDSASDAGNVLLVRIDYRIRSNNAFYNLVYPFFLEEGAARRSGQ